MTSVPIEVDKSGLINTFFFDILRALKREDFSFLMFSFASSSIVWR